QRVPIKQHSFPTRRSSDLEAKPGSNDLQVTGQLLDLSNPGIAGKDVNITLSNLRGHVVHAVSNQHGEFTCDIKNSGDLQITFSRSEEHTSELQSPYDLVCR